MALPELETGSPLRVALEPLAQGHLSFLLGAGASMSAHLPDWTTLLTRLLKARRLDEDAARALLSRQDNLFAAAAAFAPNVGRKRRDAAIYKALYGTSDTAVAMREFAPSRMHLAIAGDAVQRGADNVGLLTMNFDDLFEEALTATLLEQDPTLTPTTASARVRYRSEGRRAARAHQFEVHHLHGLLPRSHPESLGDSLILTLADFNSVISDTASWQRSQVQDVLQRGPLLLVGTSYSDPDLRQWLSQLNERSLDPVIALIPRQSLGLSADAAARIQSTITAQWASVGVDCLLVDDFAEVSQAIRELRFLPEPGYRPPAERAADAYATRVAAFSTTQAADAELLADQAKTVLSPILGPNPNLTLWLHDGVEDLVRWATNDRHYRSPDALRHIDCDLESAWIVAQAICSDEERFQDISVQTASPGQPPVTTGRWNSVLARPVHAELPHGPPVAIGAISSASTSQVDDVDLEAWSAAMSSLEAMWSGRLGAP